MSGMTVFIYPDDAVVGSRFIACGEIVGHLANNKVAVKFKDNSDANNLRARTHYVLTLKKELKQGVAKGNDGGRNPVELREITPDGEYIFIDR